MPMVELNRETKLIISFFFILSITSCRTNKSNFETFKLDDNYWLHEYNSSLENTRVTEIRQSINDTLSRWVDQKRTAAKDIIYSDYQLGNSIVFSKDSSMLLTTTLKRSNLFRNSIFDYINYLFGWKINEKWYFSKGESFVISRIAYQSQKYKSLTFEELNYISHVKVMGSRFLEFDKKLGLIPKEENFIYRTPQNTLRDHTKKQRDSVVLEYMAKQQSKFIDSLEIISIEKAIEESHKATLEKLTEEEKNRFKIFESESWKNRHITRKEKMKLYERAN